MQFKLAGYRSLPSGDILKREVLCDFFFSIVQVKSPYPAAPPRIYMVLRIFTGFRTRRGDSEKKLFEDSFGFF